MKKFLVLIVILMLSFVLSSTLIEAKTIIRLSTTFGEEHIDTRVARTFKDLVEGMTDQIEVQVFPSCQLGSEDEIPQQIASNSLEMQADGFMILDAYANDYGYFDSCYVWNNYDHWLNAWNSEVGEAARRKLAETANSEYLGVYYVGARHTTSNKPLTKVEDFQGLKIRVPMIPAWVETWKGIGANPIPISLTELFMALQTGTAEASEGPAGQILTYKLYEVQDYYTLTNHAVQAGDLVISKKFFEALDPELQKILKEAGSKACEWGTKTSIEVEQLQIAELESKGMKIIIPDAKALKEKAVPALKTLFERDWPTATLEQISSFAE